MARPRYRPDDDTARDRIAQAFWALLAREPYGRLTVLGIVREAGLNKNTFYYHYDGIDDMASSIVAESFRPDALRRLLATIDEGRPAPDERFDEAFDRVCLIAGDHSTPALQEMLKDALRHMWSGMLGIEIDRLRQEDRLLFEFAVGGVTSLYALRARHPGFFRVTDLMASDVRRQVEQILAQVAGRRV